MEVKDCDKPKYDETKDLIDGAADGNKSDQHSVDDDFQNVPKKSISRVINSDSENEGESNENVSKKKKVFNISDDDSDIEDSRQSRKKLKRVSEYEEDEDSYRISSYSEEDEEEKESKGNGRKKIRKVKTTSELSTTTQKAIQEEQDRKKRLAEKQKEYNENFTVAQSMNGVIDRLVLDGDPNYTVELDKSIATKLKVHQANGIRFIFNNTIESVEQYKLSKNGGSGCILGHCMGLGKTLQSVAFIHSVMTCEHLDIKSVLVLTPYNTVFNWCNEFRTWLKDCDNKLIVHRLFEGKDVDARLGLLKSWKRRGGVGILHYEGFRLLVDDSEPKPGKNGKIKKPTKQQLKLQQNRSVIKECLLDYPDIIIADEGHVFKNPKSKLCYTVNKLKSKRRVILTGTPLQNNLMEYYTMMQFVKPSLLGDVKEFRNRFLNPIENGQLKDSSPADVALMKKRSHVLHKLLDDCVQRMNYTVLTPYLPPKFEYVIPVQLSELQVKLYAHYLQSIESVTERVKNRMFFKDFAALSKVWAHPSVLKVKQNKEGDFVASTSTTSGYASDLDVEQEVENDDDMAEDYPDPDFLIPDVEMEEGTEEDGVLTGMNYYFRDQNEEEKQVPLSSDIIEQGGDWWSQFFECKDDIDRLEMGSKFVVLLEIIRMCENIGDRLLIFSQTLTSLDLIESYLEELDKEARHGLNLFDTRVSTRWRKGIEYFRIDGGVKSEDRQKDCQTFNKNTDSSRAKLFLISTKAGGIGINLQAANRVVIFDASWNPAQDLQSIFRVYRFGQRKPCYVYRLLGKGTMEEKIYNRQIVKLSTSGRVVDEHQITRHFTLEDFKEMYKFEPYEIRDTPSVPKDKLLGQLMISLPDHVQSYIEHDSLLENRIDEDLSEQERQDAWMEFHTQNKNQAYRRNTFSALQQQTGLVDRERETEEEENGEKYDVIGVVKNQDDILNQQDFNEVKQRVGNLYSHFTQAKRDKCFRYAKADIYRVENLVENYHEQVLSMNKKKRTEYLKKIEDAFKNIDDYLSEPEVLSKAAGVLF